MAIPSKGSRHIVVEGENYRWLIRRKATYSQSDYGSGRLHVAVEHSSQTGAKLVVITDKPHPKDWATKEVIAITPKDVGFWIKQALSKGWNPKKPGGQFKLDLDQKA